MPRRNPENVITLGNPASLVADVTAALTDKSEVQPVTDPSTATTPSIAAAQDSPPVATDAPTRAETAAAPEPAAQSRAELDPPPSEAMFKQFQAWAAEEDARAQAEPAKPAEAKPADEKPADEKPAEEKPAVETPAAPAPASDDPFAEPAKPGDAKPAEPTAPAPAGDDPFAEPAKP